MTTLQKIINYLQEQPNSRPQMIADKTGVSRQYVQRLLASHGHLFVVSGTGPNRFYRMAQPTNPPTVLTNNPTTPKQSELINKHFYTLDPLGNELIGETGLAKWCRARGYDIIKMQSEYLAIISKYYPATFRQPIDFTDKVADVFGDGMAVKKVWACDFYNFEVFGKTKLGSEVLIAKQTGDSVIIKDLISVLQASVDAIRSKVKVDAVAFVSPTIQRPTQLMTRLEQTIAPDLPRLKITKISARILVPQKTLKSLADRIVNAEQTFAVESPVSYKNVLIIDDALGSGATVNEISKQIKSRGFASSCYALTLVASPSGYEVINEV